MTNNTHKARAINKRATLARYDGKCPYPRCQSRGEIRAYQDYIVNGPLGWGHSECVNAKIHFSPVGMGSLCKTTQNQRMVHAYEDWGDVTCKKCLKMKDTPKYVEALEEGIEYLLGGQFSHDEMTEEKVTRITYHVEELKKHGIDRTDAVTTYADRLWRITESHRAETADHIYTIDKFERGKTDDPIGYKIKMFEKDNKYESEEDEEDYETRTRFTTLEETIAYLVDYAELFEIEVPVFN